MRRTASCSLFDLAPNGVYPAPSVTLGAVGSYPTISTLPFNMFGAVYFLWHFPFHVILRMDSRVNHGTFRPAESGLSSLRKPESDRYTLSAENGLVERARNGNVKIMENG